MWWLQSAGAGAEGGACLEGEWLGVHLLGDEATGTAPRLPQRDPWRRQQGQAHVLHRQSPGE